MRRIEFIPAFFMLVLFTGFIMPEDAALTIIDRLIVKMDKINDYEADAIVDTKIKFLKILPSKAKVYYKKPDLFRVKSNGIAILPKENFGNLITLLKRKGSYLPVISGTEKSTSRELYIINIIPLSDTSEVILAKLWIDEANDLIIKSQLTTRSNGTVMINYQYKDYIQWGVPDHITFTIDVKKFKVPKAIAADLNSSSKNAENPELTGKGQIEISLKNYIFNKGLSSEIFKK